MKGSAQEISKAAVVIKYGQLIKCRYGGGLIIIPKVKVR